MSNAKSFDILVTDLCILHTNYFDDPTKLNF